MEIGRYELSVTAAGRRFTFSLATDEQLGLRADGTVILPEYVPLALPRKREHPVDVLLRMGRVDRLEDLGTLGLLASVSDVENEGNAEVRRYEAVFARDTLATAESLQDVFPQLEYNVVRYLGAYQADSAEASKRSERGKIAGHIRDPQDPLAIQLTKEEGRGWPVYNQADATVRWLQAACRVLEADPSRATEPLIYPADHARAGEVVEYLGRPHTLGRALVEAVGWQLRQLDPAMDGLMQAPMKNKDSFGYWRDSPNTFSHPDGRLAGPPLAPLGLQTGVLDGLLAAARLMDDLPAECSVDDIPVTSELLRTAGQALRQQILQSYLVSDDAGTFLADAVTAAGGVLEPVAVRTIEMALALDSELLVGEEHRPLVENILRDLFSDRFLTAFGLTGRDRTDVRSEKFDYHAQVWAVVVAKAANGLHSRHGYHGLAYELEARLMRHTADGLLPEFVGGGAGKTLEYCPHKLTVHRPMCTGEGMTNSVKERPPSAYQAWTAGPIIAIDAASREPARESADRQRAFERSVLSGLSERAYRSHRDLAWDATGTRLRRFSGIATTRAHVRPRRRNDSTRPAMPLRPRGASGKPTSQPRVAGHGRHQAR